MDELFVGRQRELELLQSLWESSTPELLILYGRRRVGKTRLLTRWIETTAPRVLFWVTEPASSFEQLRSFSQSLYNFEMPESPAPGNFTYANWHQAFQQVARIAQSQRLAVFLDEITYLLEAEPSVAGILQNEWDQTLKQANLFLGLSGSHVGMMERKLLVYSAPLYGRATALLRLQPLPFSATRQFFPKYSPDERVAVYAMVGGIPAYWERFDPDLNVDENIHKEFLSEYLLYDEPRVLLHDFITDLHNYVSILRALAHGRRTPTEIAHYTGLDAKHVPPYLSKLVNTGFVERRTPVTALESAPLGRHAITDPFLRFYYRFLSLRQPQLSLGVREQALAEFNRHMIDFIGTHTWEELCREWVLRADAMGKLPFMPDQVGSAWDRTVQVDVVGINRMEKTLILGECKWTQEAVERKVMADLVEEKAAKVVPTQGKWQVYFLGFSRNGWTSGALAYQDEINRHPVKGSNWKSVGMRLLDLGQVDDNLAAWTV